MQNGEKKQTSLSHQDDVSPGVAYSLTKKSLSKKEIDKNI